MTVIYIKFLYSQKNKKTYIKDIEMTVNGVTHTYERGDAYDCRSMSIGNNNKNQLKTERNQNYELQIFPRRKADI